MIYLFNDEDMDRLTSVSIDYSPGQSDEKPEMTTMDR